MTYAPNLAKLSNQQKGAIFCSVVKSSLLLEGFVVAVPEPDFGDDLWVGDLTATKPRIHRAQLKSSFVSRTRKRDGLRTYTVNVQEKQFKLALEQSFFFLVGLYDTAVPKTQFHIGCIPSSFFKRPWEASKIRHAFKNRVALDFHVSEDATNYLFNAKVEHRVCVTQFFQGFEAFREHNWNSWEETVTGTNGTVGT